MTEGPRLAKQPLGVALLADRGDLDEAAALDGERTGPDRLAGDATDRAGLPGQEGLVESQALRLDERPVPHHLVAGLEAEHVAVDELLNTDVALGAITNHPRSGRDEQREAVERSLRTDLLRDPDRAVGHEDPEEEGVAPVAEQQRDRAERQQDEVEDGQDVGADDARVRAARRRAA